MKENMKKANPLTNSKNWRNLQDIMGIKRKSAIPTLIDHTKKLNTDNEKATVFYNNLKKTFQHEGDPDDPHRPNHYNDTHKNK